MPANHENGLGRRRRAARQRDVDAIGCRHKERLLVRLVLIDDEAVQGVGARLDDLERVVTRRRDRVERLHRILDRCVLGLADLGDIVGEDRRVFRAAADLLLLYHTVCRRMNLALVKGDILRHGQREGRILREFHRLVRRRQQRHHSVPRRRDRLIQVVVERFVHLRHFLRDDIGGGVCKGHILGNGK